MNNVSCPSKKSELKKIISRNIVLMKKKVNINMLIDFEIMSVV